MFRSVPCSSHFPEIGGQSGCRHSRCRSLPRRHHRHWADKGGTPRKPATRSRGSRQLRSEATTGQVCFRRSRCVIMYIISKDKLCASGERVHAILQYATPTEIRQLNSFVGKLNYYYGKFLPAFASVCAPLNQLRCKDTVEVVNRVCRSTEANARGQDTSCAFRP